MKQSHNTKNLVTEQIHYGSGDNISGDKYVIVLPESNKEQIRRFNFSFPARPLLVKGRNYDLERLHRLIQKNESNLILVQSIGGIGKTSFVMEYLNIAKYRNCYDNVLWISTNPEGVNEDVNPIVQRILTEVAEFTDLGFGSFSEKSLMASTFLSSIGGNNLVVIDNVNELKLLMDAESFLLTIKWRVIIITRSPTTDYQVFQLKPLTKTQAYSLFIHYCKKKIEREKVIKLLSSIQYHTFLIELIAKTIQKSNYIQIDELIILIYQAKFYNPSFSNIKVKINQPKYHQINVFESNVSDFLQQLFPLSNLTFAEEKALMLFALILPEDYSTEWLLKYFSKDICNEDEKIFNITLSELVAKGLIIQSYSASKNQMFYRCHQIVQYIAFKHFEPEPQKCYHFLTAIGKDSSFNYSLKPTEQAKNLLILENVDDKIGALLSKQTLEIKEGIRYSYWTLGYYKKAIDIASQNLKLAINIYGFITDEVAEFFCHLAISYERFGNYEKALKYDKQAISIRESIKNLDPLTLAKTYNNTAQVYRQLLDYEKAIQHDLKAIKLKKSSLTKTHLSLAISYCNHGITLYKSGNYLNSLQYVKKAIRIRLKRLDKDHSELGTAYYHKAIALFYLKNYKRAINYNTKAISIWNKCYPENHPYLKFANKWRDDILKFK